MRRPLIRGALAAFLLLACSPAGAWSPLTRVRMVDEAIRLMPESLRMALEGHREELRRGALGPLTGEDGPEHRPPWGEGTLDRSMEAEARELVAILSKPTPFSEIAERFGRLAHFVVDAGFPPAMSDTDGDRRYHHFSGFCESRLEKFPLVFYGHGDPGPAVGVDFRALAREIMERARGEDGELARAYAAAGEPPDPMAFDDRSVPFAVASLSYSRSVTDVVRVWLAAWNEAGGDIGRTPYLEKAKGDGDPEKRNRPRKPSEGP